MMKHKDNRISIANKEQDTIVDKLKGISIQDIALMGEYECMKISLFQQRRELQNLAFKLDKNHENITKEMAKMLNDIMYAITMELECEYEMDFSSDYIIDFDKYVKGNEDMPRCY